MTVRYRRAASVDMAPMQNETILFNPASNSFCLLNSSAALVWESLESPQPVSVLVAQLCAAFSDVDETQATKDVESALAELTSLSLVSVE